MNQVGLDPTGCLSLDVPGSGGGLTEWCRKRACSAALCAWIPAFTGMTVSFTAVTAAARVSRPRTIWLSVDRRGRIWDGSLPCPCGFQISRGWRAGGFEICIYIGMMMGMQILFLWLL